MSQIQFKPNIGKKIIATIVDYGIYLTFWSFYVYQFGTPNDEGGYSVNGWPGFILFLTWFAYFPLVESFNGQTIGHMITQLRVVTLNGNPITFGQSLKRRILDGLELFPTFGLIAFIAVKNSKRNQRVGDMWEKTIVIEEESVSCQHCGEQLTLTARETLSGTFNCPECGKETKTNNS